MLLTNAYITSAANIRDKHKAMYALYTIAYFQAYISILVPNTRVGRINMAYLDMHFNLGIKIAAGERRGK